MIRDLFPPEVITVEASEEMWDGPLYPEEEACLTRAVSKRRREFTAGRICARKGLALLGIENHPLIAGPDRLPLWPEGILGSLTHTEGYCGLALCRRGTIVGLGLDAERRDPLQPRLTRMICRPGEIERLRSLAGPASEGELAKIAFSAKETVYKSIYPLTRVMLEFHDVELDLELSASTFAARILRAGGAPPGLDVVHGRFTLGPSHVFCAVTLLSRDAGAVSGGSESRQGVDPASPAGLTAAPTAGTT